jgi:hypothetical protein
MVSRHFRYVGRGNPARRGGRFPSKEVLSWVRWIKDALRILQGGPECRFSALFPYRAAAHLTIRVFHRLGSMK